MRLGIDFGTTRTVVAAVEDGRHPVAAFDLDDGFRTWLPGVAAWDGSWRFGADALDALRAGKPGLRSVKRAVSRLAPDAELALPGAPPTSALALTTAFLSWMKETLIARGNISMERGERLEAMVAVPANASSRQRFLTLEAFAAAGLEVIGMVNEPTAAAIELAYRSRRVIAPRSPKRYVVVYDLGGGTFDTAAVSLEGQRFTLLHSEGIGRLGGEDFDELILALALAGWGLDDGELAPGERVQLLEQCRAAKETLSSKSQRLLVDPAGLLDLGPTVLDVRTLYARAEPIIERTLSSLDRVFARLVEHGLDPEDGRELGGVYLVGGAVAFPAVLRALRARYGRKVQLAPEPHAATAIGLAVAADEDAGVLVREASTRTLGVWREAEGGRDTRFDPILQKDTLPTDGPLVVRRRYRPRHTIGHLRFVECTALDARGRPDGDLTPWTGLHFPYDPRLATRDDLAEAPVERTAEPGDEILETYTYEPDGRVRVRIENLARHYGRELELGALR